MRIPSGTTDQYIYFVAVDSTDLSSRETGLSSFTVYRSRNGAAAAAMTTPTINETDSTNMPGVYELLLDEDMTIGSGNDSEEMCFHITQASMAPVTRTIELYRSKITGGNTLGVASDGDISGNVDGNVVGSVASVTGAVGSVAGHTPQTGDSFARIGANGAGLTDLATQASVDTVDNNVDAILLDTAEIGAAGAGLTALASQTSVDTLDGIADSILQDTGTTIPGTITALQTTADDIEADTQDIQGRLPAALIGGKMDAGNILYAGTTTSAGTATTLIDTSLSQADDNHWKGGLVVVTSGALAGQHQPITAFDEGTDTLTFAAFTQSVGSGITYEIHPFVESATVSEVWSHAGGRTLSAPTNITSDDTVINSTQLLADTTAILEDTGTTLDGKVDTLVTNIGAILDDTGTDGVVLTAAERTAVANAIWDLVDGIETGLTPRQSMRIKAATTAGKSSGLNSSTAIYRNAVADDTNRVTANVDEHGNRTAVTYNLT